MERPETRNPDKIKGYFKDKYFELYTFYNDHKLWLRPENKTLSEDQKRHYCPVQPYIVSKWKRDFQSPRYHPESTDEENFQIIVARLKSGLFRFCPITSDFKLKFLRIF